MVMAPGPDFMNVVGQSLRGSFRNGLMSAVGVVAGSCVHVTAAIVGLSAILLSSALAYEAVRWTGAAYLIFLGIRSLFSRSSGESTNVSDHALSNRPINRAFRKGFLVNILNPKAAITFMAFMPQFVHPEKARFAAIPDARGSHYHLCLRMVLLCCGCCAFCRIQDPRKQNVLADAGEGDRLHPGRTRFEAGSGETCTLGPETAFFLTQRARRVAEGDRFECKRCFSLRPQREIFEVSTPTALDVVLKPTVGLLAQEYRLRLKRP